MPPAVLFSIVESPAHPDFTGLYQALGFTEVRLNSIRKAIAELRNRTPDVVVAEFFYGYGNNYAGVNISNLDVLLFSLQRYAPDAKVIVMVDKSERMFIDDLNRIFPLHAVLQLPVTERDIEAALADPDVPDGVSG